MRTLDFSSWQAVLTTLMGLVVFTLLAAYRTLGGSFTGKLTVDPKHLRELGADAQAGSDRARRIRDAVEAALADILLLGTEEHCRLAGQAASDMAAGRPIHTADLVISLRNFIRAALDLAPMPADVRIPLQGPTRTQGSGARGKGEGGGGGAKGGGGGGGMGMGIGPGHHGGGHEALDPSAGQV